jgi:hypothetical protein
MPRKSMNLPPKDKHILCMLLIDDKTNKKSEDNQYV